VAAIEAMTSEMLNMLGWRECCLDGTKEQSWYTMLQDMHMWNLFNANSVYCSSSFISHIYVAFFWKCNTSIFYGYYYFSW
jgi:hypothetical protein